jgi:hypothetical protein
MKEIINNIKSNSKFLFAMAIAFVFMSCGTIDNFDSDPFSFFGSKKKKDSEEFLRYSENKLNQPPLIEFILDNSDAESINLNIDLRKVCDYTKLPYKAIEIKVWNSSAVFSPSTRVICLSGTTKLSSTSIDRITEFVANGGTLFLPFANEDHRMAFLCGFRPEAEFETDAKSSGWYLNTPMLPNLKGKTFLSNVVHFGFAKENFSNKIKILASAINNPDYPLVVENRIGEGRVLLYNRTGVYAKADRGLLFAGILKGLESIPYPIANVSTIFLDDFPSPLYDIKAEPIASEMNLTMSDFVKKVWWPDMIALSKEYKIPYTAMSIFDYRNKVQPPFTLDQWDAKKNNEKNKTEPIGDWLIRDVVKNGHELAFHGYNHVSLTTHLWENQQFIGTALNTVKKKWEISDFGNLPTSYVPPSNVIDKNGLKELKKAMPSLKYMCSVYLGETFEGGNREFDYDPYSNEFFDYPRITDGFCLTDDQQYDQQSLYLFTGIWTHFVHPDDVFQIPSKNNKSAGDFDLRNPLGYGWHKTKGKSKAMYPEFKKYLKELTTTFPQMRFLNANDASKIVIDWRASRYIHKTENGVYVVDENNPDEKPKQHWFMYGSPENADKIETQLKNQAVLFSKTPLMDGYLYAIHTNKPKLSVIDFNYKDENQKTIQAQINQIVKSDYNKYIEAVKKFKAGAIWVDDYDEKFKLELLTLRNKMLNEPIIDSITWNKYAKYRSWENRGEEVWELLENHIVKHPSPKNILYSKELSRIIDYPNDSVKEKWLNTQMSVTPNDTALLNDYIESFNTPRNQEKIKNAFVNLLKLDTRIDIYLQYIQHLLTYDTKKALIELSEVKPSEKLKSIATDITWLYNETNQFQLAYDWSIYSSEIDFATKMSWLIELKSYDVLEAEYKKYIAKNETDYNAKSIMCSVYLETGRFKEAWLLADSLPECVEKENLKASLNKDVMDVDTALQQDLLENHSALFYPQVSQTLIKTNRIENGNFIAFNSSLESNKKDPSAFKNTVSYNLYDKKKNLHSLGATFSKMYKLDFEILDDDNVTHTVYGLQYQFNNPKKDEKLQYWSRIRGEYSDFGKYYFQFGAGANFSKNKRYTSAEFKIFPTETGPAYSKNIYRMQGNLYQDTYLFGILNVSLSLEGNYYTQSKSKTVTKTSDSYEASSTGKIILDNNKDVKSKFLPFIEASYLKSSIGEATINSSSSYPYWIIDNRFYAGGGLGWKFGKIDSNFNSRLEAAWFDDNYKGDVYIDENGDVSSDNGSDFKRFTGEISYQIFDYTAIMTSFEVYSQSNFYSNVIQFGVKYNLKKRQKK